MLSGIEACPRVASLVRGRWRAPRGHRAGAMPVAVRPPNKPSCADCLAYLRAPADYARTLRLEPLPRDSY
jgi:hypothetical protein